jgi:hypothetical protein
MRTDHYIEVVLVSKSTRNEYSDPYDTAIFFSFKAFNIITYRKKEYYNNSILNFSQQKIIN